MTLLKRLLSTAALALTLTGTQALAQTKITIGDVGSGSTNHWPAYIAQQKGFFKEKGLDVEFVAAQSSSAAVQQLAAGSVEMAVGGLVDPIRAIDKGAPVTLFRTEAMAAPYEIYAKADIKTYADLRKKVIMIGGVKDITRIYLERMLGPNGLKPGDYDLVFAGATAARFSALASGSIDATILNAPFNFKAKGLGLTRLGATPDYVRDFPFTGYSVATAWAKTHKTELAGFLEAYRRGVDWFYDPANHTEAVDIMQKLLKVDRADIDQTWAFYNELKVFDREGRVAASGIENLLKSLKDYGDIEGATDVARFVNADVLPK